MLVQAGNCLDESKKGTYHMLASSKSQQTHRRAGFTLIELLVVVAVICLLIAILLPSLSQAKRYAKTVKCAAQIKHIDLAMYEYAQEWSDAILGNAHTSGSFLLNPLSAPQIYPTANGTYSDLNCPTISQIWDWSAPAAAEMGLPYETGGNFQSRKKRFIQMNTSTAFLCPENDILAASYASASFPAPTTAMLSYNTACCFQYLFDANDPQGNYPYWDVGYSDVTFQGYTPKIGSVGNPSQKIFIADGARWSDGAASPDVNLGYMGSGSSPGGHYSDYGPWSTYSRSYNLPRGRGWAMRHGSRNPNAPLSAYKFNAGFFDGHVETMDGLSGANPALWVPSGGQVLYDACFPEVQTKYFSGAAGSYLHVP